MTNGQIVQILPWVAAGIVIAIIESKREIRKRKLEQVDLKKKEHFKENYIIQSERFIYWLMIVAFLLFSMALYFSFVLDQADSFTLTGFGGFTLVALYGVLNTGVWKITVKGEDIIYRNSFGITKKYQFDDITCAVEKRSGALRIYSGTKKLFTFDDNIDYFNFNIKLSQKGIPKKTWEEFQGMNTDQFLITTPIVYKILSVFETLVIAALGGIYIYTNGNVNTVGIVLIFAIFMMLFITIDLFVDKTEVSGSQLIRNRLFHKTKVVEMRDISYVKIRKNLFRENLILYANEKKITKIWVKNNAFHYIRSKLAKEKIHYRK